MLNKIAIPGGNSGLEMVSFKTFWINDTVKVFSITDPERKVRNYQVTLNLLVGWFQMVYNSGANSVKIPHSSTEKIGNAA